ncbi:head-tail connector protein [Aliamphritea ceti]|uniref:head-tail connector protein n=1 Tax=Aliamphritea ceti TaxID=1524258 RepID=UPI0021C40577|nr:head-tail connector protein [Aliamphritea ceti]
MPIIDATPPAETPITLEDARVQCMLDADITDEDGLIESYIKSAMLFCEGRMNRPIIRQEKQYVGEFKSSIELTPNLLTVESVDYLNTSGEKVTLPAANYFINTAEIVGKVQLLMSVPAVKTPHPQPVTINFTCGYGAAEDVPDDIKQAIRLLVGHWFRNREAAGAVAGEVEFSVSSLLSNYRVLEV